MEDKTSEARKVKDLSEQGVELTFFNRFNLFIFREGKRGRRRGRETSMCACLSHTPYWRPGPKPRHVLWLGIEHVTLWFAGQHSIHWATQARAELTFYVDFENTKNNYRSQGINRKTHVLLWRFLNIICLDIFSWKNIFTSDLCLLHYLDTFMLNVCLLFVLNHINLYNWGCTNSAWNA